MAGMAPEHDPDEQGSIGYRLGVLAGTVRAVQQTMGLQSDSLTRLLTDIKLDTHRHIDEVRNEVREYKKDVERKLEVAESEYKKQLSEYQKQLGDHQKQLRELFKWVWIAIGGAVVAWYFLVPLLERIHKP